MAEGPWYVREVLPNILGLNHSDLVKNSHQEVVGDVTYTFHGDSYEEQLPKFAVLALLPKRTTHMNRITYMNTSRSRIFTYNMVRFLAKTKVSERQKSRYHENREEGGPVCWVQSCRFA